jgi:hypothetical protein
MKKIYSNFDGLDIAFQGSVSKKILAQLAEAQKEAQEGQKEEVIELGKSHLKVCVATSGGSGGYAYRFDTGVDGAVWFVAKSNDVKRWNVRVSVKSLAFALHGYEGVKNHILHVLDCLEARGKGRIDKATGKFTDQPLESISRFDFCVDFIAPNFQINSEHFIAHSRSTKQIYGKTLELDTVRRGNNIESVRIGKMPNKQVAIYNKTKEIINNNKSYWWKIWGIDKDSVECDVWRVEVRAGKEELIKWESRTFTALEEKAGNITDHILKSIRYVNPSADKNHTRWKSKPIWNDTIKAVNEGMMEYTSQEAKREDILKGFHAEKLAIYQQQMMGLAVSYGALKGVKIKDLPELMKHLSIDMKDDLLWNFNKIQDKYEKAVQRFSMLH